MAGAAAGDKGKRDERQEHEPSRCARSVPHHLTVRSIKDAAFAWASVRECHPKSLARVRPSRRAYNFKWKEPRALNLWKRYIVRRHRKEHERVEAERARQKALSAQDAQEAVRDAAEGSAVAQQGIFGQSQPG